MNPEALNDRSFDSYLPQARGIAIEYLADLKELPVPVLVSFLDQIAVWDWKFPAEKSDLRAQLSALGRLPTAELRRLTEPFAKIVLPREIAKLDWLNAPALFLEHLTAYLWSSKQIDSYRAAAKALIEAVSGLEQSRVPEPQRLVIVTAGEELVAGDYPLFSKLRKHGLLALRVSPDGAHAQLSEILARRSVGASHAYAQWVLDGGPASDTDLPGVHVSFGALDPLRRTVLKTMEHAITSGAGPELLRTQLASLKPSDCNAKVVTQDPVLQHFFVSLFTQGSGTQIYSTSFVQWSAREILRRAQPQTLLMRIAPRVRQRSLNEFSSAGPADREPDCAGSLVDGDLAAYYTWLELEKLRGGVGSVFLAWFQGHKQAVLIGPGVPKNVSTSNSLTLRQVLDFAHLAG